MEKVVVVSGVRTPIGGYGGRIFISLCWCRSRLRWLDIHIRREPIEPERYNGCCLPDFSFLGRTNAGQAAIDSLRGAVQTAHDPSC